LARPQGLDADAPGSQIRDAAEAFPAEELEATDTHTGQERDRRPRINPDDGRSGEIEAEIDLAAPDRVP
jgi:hypothetical protein